MYRSERITIRHNLAKFLQNPTNHDLFKYY